MLFLHQRVGGQKDRIVQRCSATVMPSVAAIPSISGIAAGGQIDEFGVDRDGCRVVCGRRGVLIVPGLIRRTRSYLVQRAANPMRRAQRHELLSSCGLPDDTPEEGWGTG